MELWHVFRYPEFIIIINVVKLSNDEMLDELGIWHALIRGETDKKM